MERAIRKYSSLAIQSQDRLLYGVSPHPLECGLGLTIGGGLVYPEVNFTLPTMSMDDGTWGEVVAHYEQMAGQILRRAASLRTPGIVLEFELLPPMTERPEWGAEYGAAEAPFAELPRQVSSALRSARHSHRHARPTEAAPDENRAGVGLSAAII